MVAKDTLHLPEVKWTFQIAGNFPSSAQAFPNQTRHKPQKLAFFPAVGKITDEVVHYGPNQVTWHTPPPTSSNIPLYLKGIHCTNKYVFFKVL